MFVPQKAKRSDRKKCYKHVTRSTPSFMNKFRNLPRSFLSPSKEEYRLLQKDCRSCRGKIPPLLSLTTANGNRPTTTTTTTTTNPRWKQAKWNPKNPLKLGRQGNPKRWTKKNLKSAEENRTIPYVKTREGREKPFSAPEQGRLLCCYKSEPKIFFKNFFDARKQLETAETAYWIRHSNARQEKRSTGSKLCRKKNSGNVATLRARSEERGRRKTRRPGETPGTGERPTNPIQLRRPDCDQYYYYYLFRRIFATWREKKRGCFWEKWAQVATLRGKIKLESPYLEGSFQ